ncbi:MAG: type II toxin-antitoxin system prevent-host-death family antitoxin [Actinobacteria bacterium]|nr:type II toxin-antitoxin system prevent-host-death family antitoxin [Actinomycetota bacterium]
MREVGIREARAEITSLLEAAEAGEDVIITRRGIPMARLVAISGEPARRIAFPSRVELRRSLPSSDRPSSRLIRDTRGHDMRDGDMKGDHD